MKQLNVNIAESERLTGAQVSCRENGTTIKLGNSISIATDLAPLPAASVVGNDAGYEQLRTQELAELDPVLTALANEATPMLDTAELIVLEGWADDLSALSDAARKVADRIFQLQSDADDVAPYLAEHASAGVTAANLPELVEFLEDRGYVDAADEIIPTGTAVTVDGGTCLYVEDSALRVNSGTDCADAHDQTWFVDEANRIHSAANPDLCITYLNPIGLEACSSADVNQRWVFNDDTTVVRAANIRSAMDYNRTTKFVTTYGLSGTGNQRWIGFEKNTNPLLAYMSSRALAALVGNGPAAVDPPKQENGDNNGNTGDEGEASVDGDNGADGNKDSDDANVAKPDNGTVNADPGSVQETADTTANTDGDANGVNGTPGTGDTASTNVGSPEEPEASSQAQGTKQAEVSAQTYGLAQTGTAHCGRWARSRCSSPDRS